MASPEEERAQALFRSLTEQSLEFISILADDGTFTYVSPSVNRILGYSPDDLLGTHPVDFVHPEDRSTMLATYFAIRDGPPGTIARMTVRLRHRNGAWRYCEAGGQNLLHDPSVRGITSTARDVTPTIEAQRDSARTDARFRQFVESTSEAIIATDPAGIITYVNKNALTLFGYKADEVLGQPVFEFMPPDEAFESRNRFARRRRGYSDVLDRTVLKADGTPIHVLFAASPMFDESGEFVGTLSILTDITERKRAEGELARALESAELDRERLRATLEALPVGVWLADPTGRITHANPAAAKIWGGKAPMPEDVEGYRVYRQSWAGSSGEVEPADRTLSRVLRSGLPATGEMVEIERFDGTHGYVLNSAVPILDANGRLCGAVAVHVDITEREAVLKERDKLLQSLETERSQLASIFENAPAFLAVVRGEHHVFERCNPAYLQLVGNRDLIGRSVAEAMPELVSQGFIELLDEVRRTGKPFIGQRVPLQLQRTAGGPLEVRYVDFVYLRLTDPNGEHILVAHGVDVTELVLAIDESTFAEERLRDQFAKLPVPTFLWQADGEDFRLLEFNEIAARAHPELPVDARGKTFSEFYPDYTYVLADFRRALDENAVVELTLEFESPSLGKRNLVVTIGPQQPDRVIVHTTDTTERNNLELQLRQSQKMEAVGQLAGGVAHDFNNLLTVIGAHSAFLLEELDKSDPRRSDAKAIHMASERAAGLTRQLLAFSRKEIRKPVPVGLNDIVHETRKLLDRLLGEDIEILTDLASDLPAVLADPSQVDQILMNLAVNARDAMPAGGTLTITTRRETVRFEESNQPIPPGNYALLEVSDTGTGMDEETQLRIFEPFFTTKQPGKGTGLGLATVYGIVTHSAGYIRVESSPGMGTTFRIFMPPADDSIVQHAPGTSVSTRARGTETVLLVEDDDEVRTIASRLLARQGYRVLEASTGRAALQLSDEFRERIDLVVSDAVMPGMAGAEVVTRLREQRPALKSLFISGYTDDQVIRRGIIASEVPFIQKPFGLDDFAHAVRDALDR